MFTVEVVCFLVIVVRCALYVVCCLLYSCCAFFVGCRLLCDVSCLFVFVGVLRCLLFAVGGLLIGAFRSLFVV